MRSKRRALGLLATLALFAAALTGSFVVRPGSYHDMGTPSAAGIASGNLSSAYASLFSYHDM
jgi:hypothetical protein